MGRKERNADLFEEINRRRIEEIALKPVPISLTDQEADLLNHPVAGEVEACQLDLDEQPVRLSRGVEDRRRGHQVSWVDPQP